MKINKKLSELTLDELLIKQTKVKKLTITIQIIILIISIILFIDVLLFYTKTSSVAIIAISVIFIPYLTGLIKINKEIKTRNSN